MNRMKELREESGVSMKEAARRLGLPYTTYVNYEKGLREPNSEMLVVIADFYKCSIDYLLGKTDNRTGERGGNAQRKTDLWLLSITESVSKAHEIQSLIENGKIEEARLRLVRLCGKDVITSTADEDILFNNDPQIEKIVNLCTQINAQGLEYLHLAGSIIAGNPEYKKKSVKSTPPRVFSAEK